MRATILVELDTDSTDLLLLSEDLKDSLEQHGFTVLSCRPWKRQGLAITNPLSPVQPTGPMPIPGL